MTWEKAMRWSIVASILLCSSVPAIAQSTAEGSAAGLVGIVLVLAAIAVYFLPAIIGGKRGISSSGALFFVNLLFGWTVLGWILCFIWAAAGATRAQDAFFANAAARTPGDAAAERAYQEAYAKERARLDHEASLKARGHL